MARARRKGKLTAAIVASPDSFEAASATYHPLKARVREIDAMY